ncbi:Uncharacterised protein [Chryseobacterium taihuense]|uniref:Uncharacterized protein n=1 Tax=Chryseobacterium taihuense TaxID=1141221 RepID=A0A4U8WGR6_9FLAO|nr:Uncharacterised protein [Chryseobacterium taihuense]
MLILLLFVLMIFHSFSIIYSTQNKKHQLGLENMPSYNLRKDSIVYKKCEKLNQT